jgi:peptidoglycan hydrolase-like protein with peptidoglycan-binding domain
MDGRKRVQGEGQPGQGDDAQRQANDGAPGSGGDGSPLRHPAQILRGKLGQTRSPAARVGLTASVILGVALAAGITGLAMLGNSGGHRDAGTGVGMADGATSTAAAPPLRVVSVRPAAKTSQVSGDGSVQIEFSSRLGPTSAVPTFRPAVAGQWQASGNLLSFTPSVPFEASTRYTLEIPAGRSGLRSADGGLLKKVVLVRFKTAPYSVLRLDEVLSQLGYLPMTWQPSSGDKLTGGPSGGGVAGQAQLAFSPPTGSFTWNSGYPASLRYGWVVGRPNVVLRGAVMAFQAQHNLAINGVTTQKFWRKLFAAAASSDRNNLGYTYAIADKGSPETLTIWHNGHQVLRTLANTGIPIDPTASGTFPVYLRYRFQIMQGTNPDGSTYADPVSFVSYFDGGEAVHYFPRYSYGFPQSLGCVELPYSSAERAWPYLTYGSLVTVTG